MTKNISHAILINLQLPTKADLVCRMAFDRSFSTGLPMAVPSVEWRSYTPTTLDAGYEPMRHQYATINLIASTGAKRAGRLEVPCSKFHSRSLSLTGQCLAQLQQSEILQLADFHHARLGQLQLSPISGFAKV